MTAIVRRGPMVLALLLLSSPVWAQTASGALQGFGIVLVLGDVQEGVTADNIPPGARAALADLKDFLPYRSYRVLDTAWVLASSATRQAVSSRLQGPDDQSYQVTLDRAPVGPSSLQVRFEMSDSNAYTDAGRERDAALRSEIQRMIGARAALEKELQNSNFSGSPDDRKAHVAQGMQRMRDLQVEIEALQSQRRAVGGGQTLIDTSFNMSLGETVVVGTSRMRGGSKALIVLLTAATRGSKPRE
jgi:hypothetical protein